MKIGIVPNFTREKALSVTVNTVKRLRELGIDCLFDSISAKTLESSFESLTVTDDIYGSCDCIIAIGGDGSFIHTAKNAAVYKKPVLCINAGNLAFLAGLEGNELTLLQKLILGEYETDKRMMLEVRVKENNTEKLIGYCLNDAVAARGADIKLLDLEIFCDGRVINSYRADGVILSTPTGSTAYSWSAGGPVIDPNLQCIMLTPICTHSPLNRSLVFNEKSVITVKTAEGCDSEWQISADGGKAYPLSPDCELIISKSQLYAEFIRIKNDEFYEILNNKLTQKWR